MLSTAAPIRPAHRANIALRLLDALAKARNARRARAGYLTLEDHILRDIGLTRHEALAGADRAEWDAPDHWRRSDKW